MSESKRTPTVLVVDDDATMRDVIEIRLQEWGYAVLLACDAAEADILVSAEDPDVVLSDVVLPGTSGVELLRALKGERPDRPVVLLTAHGTIEMAVDAIKEGAADFLTKPINYRSLKAVLDEACRDQEVLARSRQLAAALEKDGGFGPFVGVSPPMREVYDLIQDVAASDASVLITGESGTGKELAARTIHDLSRRSQKRFVALNTAAIPSELVESELFGHQKGAFTGATADRAGCFEIADGGTLLLDEIAEMPIGLQPKLLRVLDEARFRRIGARQEIAVDVRTISATNREPRDAVRDGSLREDLYYRLNVLTLSLPPLRDRDGDIRLAAQYFLGAMREKHGTSMKAYRDETLRMMERYAWPGNVRELKNVVERAAVIAKGEWIEPSHLPPYVRDPTVEPMRELVIPPGMTAAELEKRLILQTLDETGNNKAAAARRLGLNEKTIRNKLKAYDLDR